MELFRTLLGDLKIIEYYLYYDRPFVFLVEDQSDTKYIVHLIDDNDDYEEWFLVPTSSIRLERVRTGKISLRKSILESENGWVWRITTPFDKSKGNAEMVFRDTIEDVDLPGENSFLNLPDNRLPKEEIDVEKEAFQSYRDVLYLYLNDGKHSQLINADDYGAILLSTQNLIHSLTYEGASHGRISKSKKEQTTLYYGGNFAASVGVKLEAKYNGITESSVSNALEKLLDLLNAGSNHDSLKEKLSNIQNRSIIRYKKLLGYLEKSKVTFRADWGSPFKGKQSATLSNYQIKKALSIMKLNEEEETHVISLKGNLIGILTDTERNKYSFDFVSLEGDLYRGSITSDLLSLVEKGGRFEVPAKDINVELEETISINLATNEEKYTYSLKSISE